MEKSCKCHVSNWDSLSCPVHGLKDKQVCPECLNETFTTFKRGDALYAECTQCFQPLLLNDPLTTGLPNREFIPASEDSDWNEDKEFDRLQEAYRIDDTQPGDYEDDVLHDPDQECPACGGFCDPWEADNKECDGSGNYTSEEDQN